MQEVHHGKFYFVDDISFWMEGLLKDSLAVIDTFQIVPVGEEYECIVVGIPKMFEIDSWTEHKKAGILIDS